VSVTAVIAAAGSGERLGAGGPKAFVPLAGRPMVEWSIGAFRAVAAVRSIVVACPPGHGHDLGDPGLPEGQGEQGSPEGGGVLRIVDGGETRSESVSNALAAVESDLVAIHDAARPLVTPELVEGVIATLLADPEAAGAIAATPVADTVKLAANAALTTDERANAAFVIEETVDRSRHWAAQTPQVFRVEALRKALGAEPERVAAATDEAMLVEATGGRVLIHPAPAENLKVTTALDLQLAALLLAERSAQ
jgi:2-C-methyl-D-erythritol 4-phosphate cytidylyltransferase